VIGDGLVENDRILVQKSVIVRIDSFDKLSSLLANPVDYLAGNTDFA
jgi:hypothetical protein